MMRVPTSQERARRSASTLLGRDLELLEVFTAGQHAFTLLASDGASEVVVRTFPSGDDAVARELAALERITALGPMVPHLVAGSADTEEPLIITTRVAGSTPDPHADLVAVAQQMAAALFSIHGLDGTGLPLAPLAPHTGESAIAHRAQQGFDRLDLRDRVLSHGDFWTGNALWVRDEATGAPCLTGVVDWSGAKHAPRGFDLAWCRQDLVLLGSRAAAASFLAEYEARLGAAISDINDWDVQTAASAADRVETWLPNYHGIGLTEMTAEMLRSRLDEWNASL